MSDAYSALDKVFHRLVLGSAVMGEMLGDLDAVLCKDPPPARDPVFVTGLARAGTTVLMRALYGTGQFASLTYADMPLVMAPNLWKRLSRTHRKARVAQERAHGDGIVVDYDAPEALEEVFWRSHCGGDYITPDGLVPHEPDADVLAAFRNYQARICHRHGAPRYLAKNNNMLLRLPALARAQPEARFLVPVRHPLSQALSLQRQHRRFAGADSFTRDYMRWLVHHEFGPERRPFRLPGQPVPDGDPDGVDHWLTTWIACYGWLAGIIDDTPAKNIRPVIHEFLGADPAAWTALAAFAGVPPETGTVFRPAPVPACPDGVSPELLAQAEALYAGLQARAGPDT